MFGSLASRHSAAVWLQPLQVVQENVRFLFVAGCAHDCSLLFVNVRVASGRFIATAFVPCLCDLGSHYVGQFSILF